MPRPASSYYEDNDAELRLAMQRSLEEEERRKQAVSVVFKRLAFTPIAIALTYLLALFVMVDARGREDVKGSSGKSQ